MFFICEKCDHLIAVSQSASPCPSCNNKIFRLAWGYGSPGGTMENLDRYSPNGPRQNPYKRNRHPGDGQGEKRTIPGDEEFGGGFGTRVRGKGEPFGEEYAEQVKKDIDDTEMTNLDFKADEGPKPGTFEDVDAPFVANDLDSHEEPTGPSNMQKGIGFQDKKLRKRRNKRQKFDPLVDNVFDFVNDQRI